MREGCTVAPLALTTATGVINQASQQLVNESKWGRVTHTWWSHPFTTDLQVMTSLGNAESWPDQARQDFANGS